MFRHAFMHSLIASNVLHYFSESSCLDGSTRPTPAAITAVLWDKPTD